MCIALPGRVVEVRGSMARVDFFGKVAEVMADFVSVRPGDHVLAFGETVIEKIPKSRAEEIARVLGGKA